MQRFKNILVHHNPMLESTAAVDRAAKLAQRNEGRVTIVNVVPTSSSFLSAIVPSTDRVIDAETDARLALLKAAVASVERLGVSAEAKALRGRPVVELMRELQVGRHDLLMKDANADSDDLFLGSLDMRLLRYCPVPLWLTKPDAKPQTNRIVVAIDPDSTGKSFRLNESIMKMASLLAYRDDSELHVVSVWKLPFDAMCNQDEYTQRYSDCEKTVEAAARDSVRQVLKSSVIGVKAERIHLRTGVPNDEIINVVNEVGPDVLVMGTLAHTGIAGLLIGNTAEKVMRRVECSVLTAKPTDFASPLMND